MTTVFGCRLRIRPIVQTVKVHPMTRMPLRFLALLVSVVAAIACASGVKRALAGDTGQDRFPKQVETASFGPHDMSPCPRADNLEGRSHCSRSCSPGRRARCEWES